MPATQSERDATDCRHTALQRAVPGLFDT